MGFLDNLAIRNTEKRLRPFMRQDERISEYEIAHVQGIGDNVPVVLTNRAIYLVGRDSIRIPYAHVLDIQSRGRALIAFSTKSGNAFMLQVVGTPKGDIYSTVSHHLDRIIKHKGIVEAPGGQVHTVCRKLDEDGPLTWVLSYSEGVTIDSPEVKAILERALRAPVDRLGVKLPW